MSYISLGKFHRLLKCSSSQRTFSILAIDHRTSLMKAFNEQNGEGLVPEVLIDFKKEIISRVGIEADAVLTDPEYGAGQSIKAEVLDGEKNLILAVEKSGYNGPTEQRSSELLAGWGIEKSARLGVDAVKLLVYYHPESKMAGKTEELVKEVSKKCDNMEIPFFLEPLTYSLDPEQKKLNGSEMGEVVIETARRLSGLGPDVMKMEFPLDFHSIDDRRVWERACSNLTSASVVPWVLLSAAVNYTEFVEQMKIACQQGASGIAVGRAVWKEAISMAVEPRKEFLSTTARKRMAELNHLCRENARPWTEVFQAQAIGDDGYEQY